MLMDISPPSSYHCDYTLDKIPMSTKYFESFFVNDCINICDERETVYTILSIKSNIIVDNTELCENTTKIKHSDYINECYLLKVYLKISFQIKYVGGCQNNRVFVDNTDFFKIVYIVIPKCINCNNVKDLFRRNKLHVHVYVEDLKTTTFNNHIIKFSLLGLANVSFITSNNLLE